MGADILVTRTLRPSPLVGRVVAREHTRGRLTATLLVDPAEPVLAGHFPGFPILPGVCLVECAHQTSLLALSQEAPTARPMLVAIERARFLAPVFPGDELGIDTSVTPIENGWRCSTRVVVHTTGSDGPHRDTAIVRLRYRSLGAAHARG